MKTVKLALFILAVVVLVTIPAQAQDAAAGKAAYTKKCQTCHGADGQGNAGMAKALKVEIRPLSHDEVQKKTDADIKKITMEGMGKMKPVKDVPAADLDNIVFYIRSLKKK
ncbi:MAG: cytochrome c [Acidobacteria bacterium]|nr:cytochrome c [Acidobacteriota bacterium]